MSDNKHMVLRFSKNLELLTQGHELKRISDECGVPLSTLHGWINQSIPSFRSIDQIKCLAAYFNVSLDELILGDLEARSRGVYLNHYIEINQKKLILILKEIDRGEENE